MKNTFGQNISITLFGESHGSEIGAVIDGLAPGIAVDTDYIKEKLSLRRPSGRISTARSEKDEFRIVSGVFDGYTTGTPLCLMIPNADTHSKDYSKLKDTPRPSHADYTAICKYHGFSDYRGGGHFSGRLTAPIVAVGAIVMKALEDKGIRIGTHIASLGGVKDKAFDPILPQIDAIGGELPVISPEAGAKMKELILSAANDGDSVGGILETAVTGMPAGVGEPWFDTAEGLLAQAMFSIPAVKGVEFGAGFGITEMRGSDANDPMRMENGEVVAAKNNSGGINGGITSGMPILFRTAVKPTPSIYKEQMTVDLSSGENETLKLEGRHDPCIVHRARVVVDAMTALTLADILAGRYGTDWLAEREKV